MKEVSIFVNFANSFHLKIKFNCEISSERAVFLDRQGYSKALAFQILKFSIHKPTLSPLKLFSEHTSSCHPFNTKKDFIKGEALRLLRTNSVEGLVHKILTEVQFTDRTEALLNKTKKAKEILPFVTTYNPATPNHKEILLKHWYIIQQQPRLKRILNRPPIVSYRMEKSLEDVLARAKLPNKEAISHFRYIKIQLDSEA